MTSLKSNSLSKAQLAELKKKGKVVLDNGFTGYVVQKITAFESRKANVNMGSAVLSFTFTYYNNLDSMWPSTTDTFGFLTHTADPNSEVVNGAIITMLTGANAWLREDHANIVVVIMDGNGIIDGIQYIVHN
ncbi:Uncharacterised protein [Serratia quinivorans]|uniref:Uncharacterized protein n=1 Tax=Serratia proteamaculans TaxID=28151 RepID=A0ABS0TRH2_SERPR|nr:MULTISPECIES: hypothetical protein [Serratia]MBI6180937.1 hypothetical protein [Serratia proteamaculans]CAI1511322.1 Uncharacterised protein [Serratia quinivorans]